MMGEIYTCGAQVAIFYSMAAVGLATWLVEKKRPAVKWLWFWIGSAAGVPILMLIIWGDQYGIRIPIPSELLLVNYALFYVYLFLLCLLPSGGLSLLAYSILSFYQPKAVQAATQRDVLYFLFLFALSVLAWLVLILLPRLSQ